MRHQLLMTCCSFIKLQLNFKTAYDNQRSSDCLVAQARAYLAACAHVVAVEHLLAVLECLICRVDNGDVALLAPGLDVIDFTRVVQLVQG